MDTHDAVTAVILDYFPMANVDTAREIGEKIAEVLEAPNQVENVRSSIQPRKQLTLVPLHKGQTNNVAAG